MTSQKRVAIGLGFLVIASLVLAACQPTTTTQAPPVVQTQLITQIVAGTSEVREVVITATPGPTEAAPAGGEEAPSLRINLGTYPDIIDPQKSSFVNEIAHLQLIYEGLTRLDENLDTVPGAAEWEYNADSTELTFTLREGLTYSDGSVLNALRYQYSILRNIDPETAGEYAQITDNIQGAAAWRTAEEGADMEALKAGVVVHAMDMSGNLCTDYEQVDCRVLHVGVDGNPSTPEPEPAPFMHTVLSLWVTYPAKEELISGGGENWWNGAPNHIGNGPFVLESLEPFVRAHFTPNPHYWRGQATYDIDFRYITDTAVSFEAYRNNEFDIIGLAAEDLSTVKADAELNAQANIYPGSCTFAVMFHQQKEPFTDPKVREAFALALDRDTWVQDVLQGLGAPTLTWIPPGFPGYKEGETRWAFDADAAKQALADSTYGGPEGLPPITATFPDTPRNRTRWDWLVAQWKDVLGVDIELNPVESTTFTALTKDINTAPQMFILGWCADYPDPQNWLSVYWMTGAFGERIAYSNPELDALLQQADAESDPAKRSEMYAQAQDMLVEGAPVAFMWNNVNAYMVKPWVTGYAKTPMDAGFIGANDPLAIQIDAAAQGGG